MFKLEILTTDVLETHAPRIEVSLLTPNSPARLLGSLSHLELSDWAGRSLRHFRPDDLSYPDIFNPYSTPVW